MKLATKLTLAITAVIAGGLTVQSVLSVNRLHEVHERETARELASFTRAMAVATAEIWRTAGEDAARVYVQAAAAGPTRLEIVNTAVPPPSDGDRLVARAPIRLGDRTLQLDATRSLDSQKEFLRHAALNQLVTAAILLVACATLVFLIGRELVGKPARALIRQARRIAAGRFTADPPNPQRDEIGLLAREMNTMAGKLADADAARRGEHLTRMLALSQLRHADRLSMVGRLASGIAHELGTPLNVVSGRAMMIASSDDAPPAVIDSARKIATQAETMAGSIQQLLEFSRQQNATLVEANLRQVLERARSLVQPLADRQRVTIALSDHSDIVATIDVGRVLQVVTNLMMNSIQAMPDGGTLVLTVHTEHCDRPIEPRAAPGTYVCISVEDEGVGIDSDSLEHIFEPFFSSTQAAGNGGLGLSVCHGIVREHGGWIEVDSEPGEGTTFAVYLPLEGEA